VHEFSAQLSYSFFPSMLTCLSTTTVDGTFKSCILATIHICVLKYPHTSIKCSAVLVFFKTKVWWYYEIMTNFNPVMLSQQSQCAAPINCKVHVTFEGSGRRAPSKRHFWLMCLVSIIRLVVLSCFLCWEVKGGSNAPKNVTFDIVCKSYEESKFVSGKGSKLV